MGGRQAPYPDNPITGHGVGMAADVIGYVAGRFFDGGQLYPDAARRDRSSRAAVLRGIILFAMWACARIYLRDLDKRAALGGPLACSFLAFGFYRLALSQRENQTLFFLLVGLTFIFVKLASERAALRGKGGVFAEKQVMGIAISRFVVLQPRASRDLDDSPPAQDKFRHQPTRRCSLGSSSRS